MSIDIFAYKEVVYEDCEEFIRWFQNTLNLRDWDILLEVGDKIPEAFDDEYVGSSPAACCPQYQFLCADVWYSPSRAKELNVHPYELLAHEMLHVLFSLVEGMDGDGANPEDDVIITRLEGPLVELFLRQAHKKLPPRQKL